MDGAIYSNQSAKERLKAGKRRETGNYSGVMILFKCMLCFWVGALTGVFLLALVQTGRDTDAPREIIQLEGETTHDGFVPLPNFAKDCAHVCGNCQLWEEEIFSWGSCNLCSITWRIRSEGDECDIEERDGVGFSHWIYPSKKLPSEHKIVRAYTENEMYVYVWNDGENWRWPNGDLFEEVVVAWLEKAGD